MELWAPIFISAVGFVWTVYSLVNYSLWDRGGPGSGLFPVISGILCAVIGVIITIRLARKKRAAAQEPIDEETRARQKASRRKVIYPFAGMLLILIGIKLIGMTLSMVLFLFLWLKFIEKYGWVKSILVAIICPACLYLIFHVALSIRLPVGLLGWI